jgi:hypothetical protein
VAKLDELDNIVELQKEDRILRDHVMDPSTDIYHKIKLAIIDL